MDEYKSLRSIVEKIDELQLLQEKLLEESKKYSDTGEEFIKIKEETDALLKTIATLQKKSTLIIENGEKLQGERIKEFAEIVKEVEKRETEVIENIGQLTKSSTDKQKLEFNKLDTFIKEQFNNVLNNVKVDNSAFSEEIIKQIDDSNLGAINGTLEIFKEAIDDFIKETGELPTKLDTSKENFISSVTLLEDATKRNIEIAESINDSIEKVNPFNWVIGFIFGTGLTSAFFLAEDILSVLK